MFPVARTSDLHLEEVGDDLVVYDYRTQAAHALNAAAAFVWEHCDGTRSATDIAAAAQTAGLPWTDETIANAIELLQSKDLLESSATIASPSTSRMSRRMLTRVAVAALVPAIVSIATPAAAIVLSGPNGTPRDSF